MFTVRRFAWVAAIGCVAALPVGAAQAASPRSAHRLCTPVRATGVGLDLGGGMTTATISSHGIVLGHTHASFTMGPITGTSASFSGPIVFTSDLGSLTANVAGAFDVSTGAFHATSQSVTGTGLLRRVTGRVTIDGLENLSTGSFTETIAGRLCVGR